MGHFLFNIVNFHFYFIYLFIVFSVSLWCLLRAPMSSFIFSVSSLFFIFLCLGISWVPFDWPCLVTSPWNSHWLLAGFLFSECSCRHCWVPWHHLSLFCWSLELSVHFLQFPLNPVLNYFGGKNGFHPIFVFTLLHLILCNYVLDKLLVVSVTCFLSLG
jgi:hypothetical protein